MSMVEYVIDINGGCRAGKKFFYDYGRTKGVELVIGKRGSTIKYSMGVRKSPDDLLNFGSKLFRDAMRKVHLLSSLINDKGLKVRLISVSIDGAVTEFDGHSENFPFMFSMLEGIPLGLPESWRSDAVLNRVVTWNKTLSDTDYLSCALNAFLVSRTRKYRIDRFLNLWTALNAVYNENALRYEKALAASMGKPREELSKSSRVVGSDLKALAVYAFSLGSYEFDKKCLSNDQMTRVFRVIDRLVNRGIIGDFETLYSATLKGHEDEVPEEIRSAARECGASPHVLLLIVLPYYLRCNYFHGSKATNIVSAYNDPEIADFGLAILYLERHLESAIPEMFYTPELDPKIDFSLLHASVKRIRK